MNSDGVQSFPKVIARKTARSRACLLVPPGSLLQRLSETLQRASRTLPSLREHDALHQLCINAPRQALCW